MIFFNFIDFLTTKVVIDNKEIQQSTTPGDVLTDKLSQVKIQLHNKQNGTSDEQSKPSSTTTLGRTNILCLVCIVITVFKLVFFFFSYLQ